jgi:hypothetical protein
VVIVVLLVLVVAVMGIIFLSGNILDAPETPPVGKFSRADGHSAQRKLFELARRGSGQSGRDEPVVFSEAEVNAFLANHLAEADLPLNPISVRFAAGQIEVAGRTPLRNLIQGQPLVHLLPYLPEHQLDQGVWVMVRGRIKIEPPAAGASRTWGRLEISEFMMGKQPLGSWLLTLMLGGTAQRLLRWPVPAAIQDVGVTDDGRLVVRTR